MDQGRAGFIEQHAIDIFVFRIIRRNRKGFKRGAKKECILTNRSDRVSDGDLRQGVTTNECIISNRGDRVTDCDLLDARAHAVPWRSTGRIVRHRTRAGDGERAFVIQRPGEVIAAGAGTAGLDGLRRRLRLESIRSL